MSAEIKHAEFCVLGCFFPGNPKISPNSHMQVSKRGETFKGFKVKTVKTKDYLNTIHFNKI